MFDFAWRDSRALRRWGSHSFPFKALFVGLLFALLLGLTSTSHAQSPPVAAYSFDDGSGTMVKDSAGNHNGTISGATWASVGKYGSALDFDGVDDLVSIADAADLDLTSKFTLEAWVQPDTITAGHPVIAKSESGGGNSGYLLSARFSSNPTGFVASSGTAKSVARPSPLPEDVWSHLAFTSDGTNLRLYTNGELVATAPANAAKATDANLVIGQGQVLGGYFDGMIDEVRIYAATLSEGEIQIDRDTAVGLDPLPVAAYSFDEGSGTTLGDSIHSHDGTISGATWTTGKYGSALNFDGVNDVVSIADAADLDLTSAFTLEAWVRPDTATNWSPVIAKNENPESGYGSGYVLFSQGPGAPRGWLSNSGTTKSATGSAALPTTPTWSHLAFASDGTNLRLYVDGQLVNTSSAISAGATATSLKIGYWAYLNTYFDGLIDEIRIYDKTLSESQIQTDRDQPVQVAALREVKTSMLSTGPSAELVASVPITSFSEDKEQVVYSLAVPSISADEVLRVIGNLEVTNTRSYPVTDSVRILLGTNPSDVSGSAVTPWTSVRQTPDMYHWTLPLSGVYHATSSLGTRYLKVILKARATAPQAGDTLTVQPNFGGIAVSRSSSAPGPMSQSTHELQPLVTPLPVATSTIPVDSNWRRVLTRKVGNLGVDDILDISAQLQLGNPDGVVRLESKVAYASAPSADASTTAAPLTSDRLVADMSPVRIVHSNQFHVTDPAKPYLNLLVRAVPISGTPSPLTVSSGTSSLNVIRHRPDPGDPSAPLREGSQVEEREDLAPDVSSVPFAPGSSPQPRVVASVSVPEPKKGEILRARGLVTGDLAGGEAAQLLTTLVLADSPTATTGETVGVFSGDKIPTLAPIRTVIKEGAYVVSKSEDLTKYLNLVVRASRGPAYTGEAMSIPAASVSLARTMPTAPLNEGFENGLDALFKYEWDGIFNTSSTVAREGTKSMLVDLNFANDYPDDAPGSRRVEARSPDLRAAGGYEGAESWYGFSVYFPDEFNVPQPNPYRIFDGLIDEVRLYNQTLSQVQIQDDRDGKYGASPTPIAAYSFDQGSGSIAEDSAGNHDGTIIGASWNASGKYGSALDFDGDHDLVKVPDASDLDFTNSFTLEAWVRPDELASLSPIVTKAKGPLNSSGYSLEAQSFNGPTGRVFNSGTDIRATGSTALPVNTWSHVAFASDGTNLRLYVNGEVVAMKSAITAAATDAALTIGASSDLVEETSGPATVFTQWRHPGNNGIDGCASAPTLRPPVVFRARYYKANSHTNPGAAETATPTAGDYLDMRFYGGELNPDCQLPVDPEQLYVLAPLERNRWYDFVQHTRWTASPGGPGNSVTELWIDGEQVLGNESTSVSTPSLFWHEYLANANVNTYTQFGLYGGDSFEDPTQRIYMDSIRSGNSYAGVAPGQ